MSQSTSRSRSVKAYDNYKLWSPPPDPATISRCPVCNSPGEVWQYSDSPDSQLLRVVMCTRGEAFGPQEGIVNEGCLLYMPPEAFYRATTKEAVRYWNDYAKALLVVRSEMRPSLSAAAPELLAALERIVQLNDRMPEDHPSRLSHGEEQQARAAIKKARAE